MSDPDHQPVASGSLDDEGRTFNRYDDTEAESFISICAGRDRPISRRKFATCAASWSTPPKTKHAEHCVYRYRLIAKPARKDRIMEATVITPSGPGAMEAGLILDEDGQRFVVLTFKELKGEPTLVTFTVPVFQKYVEHLVRTAAAANEEANWGRPG